MVLPKFHNCTMVATNYSFTMVVVVATTTGNHRCTYNSSMVVATSTNYYTFTVVVVATATHNHCSNYTGPMVVVAADHDHNHNNRPTSSVHNFHDFTSAVL